LPLPEAAERLGVSIYTVRRWIKDGKLRAFKPGKEYRVREADLAEFLAAREVRPKAPVRSSPEPSLLSELEDERRTAWKAAVDDAHRLRKDGRARLEELLAAWQASKARGELRSARRRYLDEIEELFDEAYGATHSLADILFGAGMLPATDDWEEVRAADRFYQALVEVMRDAGFRIEERKGGPSKVEEPDAA
jgi:excisionase family DNA binding protein